MELFLFTSLAINLTIPFFILSFIILIRHKSKLFDNHINLPPGKFGWPVIGETMDFITSARTGYLDRFMSNRMIRYSAKVFKTSLLGERMAVICDTSGNKFVFSNERKLVTSWFPSSVVKIVAPDLRTSVEGEFLRRRRLLSDFLKPDAVQKYIETIDYTVRQHMMTSKLWTSDSGTIRVYPVAKKMAFSLAFHVFMGIDYPTRLMERLEDQFETVSAGFLSVPIDLPGTTFRKAIKAADLMRAEFLSIMRGKRVEISEQGEKSNNFMTHLLSTSDEEGKMLRESDIANLLMGVLISSNETTTSLFTNLVYYLADDPHVYTEALKEQLEIKSLKGSEELLTWEDTKRMKYARNVINEVLRLAPPSGGAFREVIHDISYEGFTIPKGWKLFCASNTTHKNPKYFPNPEKFDPTRFEGNGPAPYSFTPFGGGPRMCPGNEFARQEALVFMHNLLINFKWEKLIPDEKIILSPSSFPESGLPIKLQRRGDDALMSEQNFPSSFQTQSDSDCTEHNIGINIQHLTMGLSTCKYLHGIGKEH